MVAQVSDQAVGVQNINKTSSDQISSVAASAHSADGQKLYQAAHALNSDTSQDHLTNLQIGHEHVVGKNGEDTEIWRDGSGNVTRTEEKTKDGGSKTRTFQYDHTTGNPTTQTLVERDKNHNITYGSSTSFDGKSGQIKSDYHQFADGSFNSRHYDSQQNLASTTEGDGHGKTVKTNFDPKTGQKTDSDVWNSANGSHEQDHFVNGHLASSRQTDSLGNQTTRKYDPSTDSMISSDTKYENGGSKHMEIDPNTNVVTNQTLLDKDGNGSAVMRDHNTGKVTSTYQIIHGHIVGQSATQH